MDCSSTHSGKSSSKKRPSSRAGRGRQYQYRHDHIQGSSSVSRTKSVSEEREVLSNFSKNSDRAMVTLKLREVEEEGPGGRAARAFEHLYLTSEFTDVNIFVEGKMMKAHRVVLALSSQYFRSVFHEISSLPCSQPVVAVRGVTSQEWEKLRKIIYCGSVQVEEDQVQSLLAAAHRLQITGLEAYSSPRSNSRGGLCRDDVDIEIIDSRDYGRRSSYEGAHSSSSSTGGYSAQMFTAGRPSQYDDIQEKMPYCPEPESTNEGSNYNQDDEIEWLDTPKPVRHHRMSVHQEVQELVSTSTAQYHSVPRETSELKAAFCLDVPQCLRYTVEEVNDMVARVENFPGSTVPCPICRKYVRRERLRKHINECHLLDGRKILCPICGMGMMSKGSYRVHMWRHRKGVMPMNQRDGFIRRDTL
ncbi:zinc finger and BTB domain-containing protein 8A [Folsomia candida]|uniref:zinc finger and BTB domain-containing protein 8A n=1 Tax=Folsomia candida TaxID=158441 RepID=UPI000B8FD26D|nr:zinc finger and BTB domain-containing protein 8A [Folsomia candida]